MEENEFEEQEQQQEGFENEEEQNELYNEIPQDIVENIDLSEAIPQEELIDVVGSNLEDSIENFIQNEEEYYNESYYEDEDFQEIENYIEVNEDTVITFNDWMYDAIINKTLKEAMSDYNHDLIDLLNEAKRDSNGFLSILHLESRDYRFICRYMEKAYKYSYSQEKRVYIRSAHNQFLKSFKNLIDIMVRDERYTMF